jgi:dihydroorotase
MQYDLIIKNGTLVTSDKSFCADIAVKEGKIAFVGNIPSIDDADDIFDAKGLHILPGIIDAHVHFRDPGLTEKEDFESASIAAAFGGITTAVDMPNVIPVTSTAERLKQKIRIAQEKSCIDFAFFALLSNDINALQREGVIGFKVFLGTSTGDIACPDEDTLLEQMKKSAAFGLRIGFHAEDSGINAAAKAHYINKRELPDAVLLSLARPVESEVSAVKKVIRYAQITKAPVHVHHVTSAPVVELIAGAKKQGLNITCETCPHYLLLDTDNNEAVKVYPPIRDAAHRLALWDAVKGGVIDMIASDHAPHEAEEKQKSIWNAPGGITGVETMVRLMLNEVNKGRITLTDFVRLASTAPAKIWGMDKSAGSDADFTIVDIQKKDVIKTDNLHSKSKTCVYAGIETQGLPVATLVRGKFIVKDGKLTGKKGTGRLTRYSQGV